MAISLHKSIFNIFIFAFLFVAPFSLFASYDENKISAFEEGTKIYASSYPESLDLSEIFPDLNHLILMLRQERHYDNQNALDNGYYGGKGDLGISNNSNVKILSIWGGAENERTFLQNAYMPSVEQLDLTSTWLRVGWMNRVFPNLKKMNVVGMEDRQDISLLLFQLTEFSSLEELSIKKEMSADAFSSINQFLLNFISLKENLHEIKLIFRIYYGNWTQNLHDQLEYEKLQFQQLTDVEIIFEYDIWSPHGNYV